MTDDPRDPDWPFERARRRFRDSVFDAESLAEIEDRVTKGLQDDEVQAMIEWFVRAERPASQIVLGGIAQETDIAMPIEVRLAGQAQRAIAKFKIETSDQPKLFTLREALTMAVLIPALQPWIDGLRRGEDNRVVTNAIALTLAIVIVLGYRFTGDDPPGA